MTFQIQTQRPNMVAAAGNVRFNTDTNQFEVYGGQQRGWTRVGNPLTLWVSVPGCGLKGHQYLDVSAEVLKWITTTQPVSSWKYENSDPEHLNHSRITVTDKLATMIKIKYS